MTSHIRKRPSAPRSSTGGGSTTAASSTSTASARIKPPRARRAWFVAAIAAWCLIAPPATADQPVGFRNDGTGQYPLANPPLRWDVVTKTGIVWSAAVGKSPFSSPVVSAGKVFVTAAPASLLCLDAATGRKLWQASSEIENPTSNEPPRPIRPDGAGNTAPTPLCDGRSVYVLFGNDVAACYDFEGKRRWIRHLDAARGTEYGRSASPLLVGGKLILSVHHLWALDPANGNVLWEAPKVSETYGTPVAARIGEDDVIVTPSGHIVRGSDGAVVANDLGMLRHASPLVSGRSIYFIDTTAAAYALPQTLPKSFPKPLALKPLWEVDLEGEFFASPVGAGDAVYAVNNAGKLFVIEAATGKTRLDRQLEIAGDEAKPGRAPVNMYPSLIVAGEHLFASNDAGDTLALSIDARMPTVAHNRAGGGSGATAAVSAESRWYLRAGENVLCIGK